MIAFVHERSQIKLNVKYYGEIVEVQVKPSDSMAKVKKLIPHLSPYSNDLMVGKKLLMEESIVSECKLSSKSVIKVVSVDNHKNWNKYFPLKKQELLSHEIKQLLGAQDTSDSMIICQNIHFPCHIPILAARAPGFSQVSGGTWHIEEASPDAVQAMLSFIYTGKLPLEDMKTRTTELLGLASLYGLPDMAEAARKTLLEKLTDENMLETLVTIDKYRVGEKDEVREKLVEFVMSRVEKIWHSEDWGAFSKNHGNIVSDIMKALDVEKASGKMLLRIELLGQGRYKVEVRHTDTVKELMSKIPNDGYKLISSGKLMKETDNLSDHNIISSRKIYMSFKRFDCCECDMFDYSDCTCEDEMEPWMKRKRY